MKNLIRRPLGGPEKLFIVLNEIAPKVFALAAELDSMITKESLAAAFSKVTKRHPQLTYRITTDVSGMYWFESNPELEIPLEVFENKDWIPLAEQSLVQPFEGSGPLFRSILMQNGQYSTIILFSHHSLGDGISMNIVLQDLLKILSGESPEPLSPPGPVDALLENIAVPDHPVFLPAPHTGEAPVNGIGIKAITNPVYIDKLRLSEGLTELLIERARKEKTTVNAALNAAVVSIIRGEDNHRADQAISFRSPASVRKTLGIGDNYGLYIVTKLVSVGADQSAGFWQLARHIGLELADVTSSKYITEYVQRFRDLLLKPVEVNQLVKGMAGAPGIDFMVTNLGRMANDMFGKVRIKSLWGPMVMSISGKEQTIGAVSTGNSLYLTNTSMFPIPGLLANTAAVLEAAVQ